MLNEIGKVTVLAIIVDVDACVYEPHCFYLPQLIMQTLSAPYPYILKVAELAVLLVQYMQVYDGDVDEPFVPITKL